jgi:epsilon-lactone hydrolase
MVSKPMQDAIDAFLTQRDAGAGKPPPPIGELRAGFTPAGTTVYPVPDDVEVISVNAGGVPAHWLVAPGADADGVLLYLHGGGFLLGSIRTHGEIASRIGRASGMRVLAVDYRLAPEHPFPAAIDDTLTAWNWLRNDQGFEAASIALAGDSAGAGLALSLLIALRDADEPLPAAAALMSPATDLTGSGDAITERADRDPVFSPDVVQLLGSFYLAGADPMNPLASPLFASLVGLPPLLVQVGTEEILFSDSERLAELATKAGVDVTFQIGEGLPHVYQIVLEAPEAVSATDQVGAFLRTKLPAQ